MDKNDKKILSQILNKEELNLIKMIKDGICVTDSHLYFVKLENSKGYAIPINGDKKDREMTSE